MTYAYHYGDAGKVYILFGRSDNLFYEFDCRTHNWRQLATLPGTRADSGANICYYYKPQTEYGPASGYIFCVPGNNTNEFWVYDISRNTWRQLEDVPEDPNSRTGVGNGAALETGNYVRIGNDLYVRIYLLKGKNGGGTREFYTYNMYITALSCSLQSRGQTIFPPGFWQRLADFTGYHNTGYGAGAEITYVPSDNSLFAFSGGGPNGYPYYFYRYDIATNTWSELGTTPNRKIVGAGASLATWGVTGNEFKSTSTTQPWHDDAVQYAFRGSWVWSNPPQWRNDFWAFNCRYHSPAGSWNQYPDDPRDPPENVGYGADLNWGRFWHGSGIAEYVYATFGETRRPSTTLGLFFPFWDEEGPDGGQDDNILLTKTKVTVTPNPFTDWTTFNLAQPASQVLVKILDNTGKLVKTIQNFEVTDRISWDGSGDNGKPVPSGVYFYFLNSDREQAKGKIIKR